MNPHLDNLFTEEQIVEIYARYSHKYHTHQRAFEAFRTLIPLDNGVLEIGVGTGVFTELLLSAGYNIKGIERSEEMLKRASERVQTITKRCDLLDYDSSGKYNVVVSHSGGFTFKREKFETYYQQEKELKQAIQRVYGVLQSEGRFLINIGEHNDEIDLGDGATFSIKQEDREKFRIYTYTFKQGNREITKQQRCLALAPEELQTMSSQYFNWNFENGLWIIGERK